MSKVQCKVCDTKQEPGDVCRRCGCTLPISEIIVEKIVERVVEKIVEVTTTIEREVPKYVCPHVICERCARGEFGADTETMAEIERRTIMNRVAATGTPCGAALSLGIGKTTLYRKLKEYGVPVRVRQ